MKTVKQLITEYYQAFNSEDDTKLFSLLHPEVIHDINQGKRTIGIEKFKSFMAHMRQCYRETCSHIHILTDETLGRGSAEFIVQGSYLKSDGKLPPAHGQNYELPVGTFFTCDKGLITRITCYYNLAEWLEIISKKTLPHSFQIRTTHGKEIERYIPDLARLRITIFREYPYLYDGTIEDEKPYLQRYVDCKESLVVLIFDENKIVGASTALPLKNELDFIQKPFIQNSFDLKDYCYFGESILEKSYRGKGLYRQLFEEREKHAKSIKASHTCFAEVDRGLHDARRPVDYFNKESTWQNYGYKKDAKLTTHFMWKEIGEAKPSSKLMHFWTKKL